MSIVSKKLTMLKSLMLIILCSTLGSGAPRSFKIVSPALNTEFTNLDPIIISWDYSGHSGRIDLKYSASNGSTWHFLSTINISEKSFYLYLPESVQGKILINISSKESNDINATVSIVRKIRAALTKDIKISRPTGNLSITPGTVLDLRLAEAADVYLYVKPANSDEYYQIEDYSQPLSHFRVRIPEYYYMLPFIDIFVVAVDNNQNYDRLRVQLNEIDIQYDKRDARKYFVITKSKDLIRTGPHHSYRILKNCYANEKYEIVGRYNEWYFIITDMGRAFIHKSNGYVKK
jgi:hypothetical protein